MSSEDLKRDKPAVHRSSHQNTIAPREQQTEKATMHGLPPMLSPTLPSDIEEELAKLTPNVRRRSVSVSKIKSPSASSLNKHRISGRVDSSTDDERVKPGREGKLNAPLKPTILASSNPLKQQQGQAHVTSAPRQVLKDSGPEKSTATKANGFAKPVAAVHANPVPTPPRSEKLRLRLRLQIKKKTNRKNLAQYLRLPPTPGKYPTFLRTMEQEYRSRTPQSERKYSGTAREHRIDEKPTVKRNFVEATQTGEKRRRSQDERDRQELPVKRHKTPGWLPQKPHTPKQSSISSPAPPNVGSAQKPQLPTPRADPKSIPAQPIESDQGALPTPQASTLNITSNGPETAHRRRSFASVGDFPTTLKHWKPESSKYFELGKTLKHDSDAFLKRSPTKTVDDCKKGVVIAIESILCFMLAFTLMDEPYREHRVPCDLSAWRTMLPFMENVAEAAGEFQLLLGLLYQLEAVIQDIMVHYDLKRLDCNPLKYSVPEDAASDPIKTEEKARAATYHKDFSRFHTQFVEGQKKWRSGWMMLGCKEMEEKFPQTWAKREQEFLAVGKSAEAITKGEYQRTVNLPMSSMTSGLQAVNFGLSILAEWTSNHGVEWQPKLVL